MLNTLLIEDYAVALIQGQKGLALKGTRQVEFLSQVVDETLRVITFPLTVSREANTDVEMNCYLIPKGWKVLTWFRNVHMDPEVYLDPRKFDPSRWDKGFIPKAGAFLLVLEAIYAKKYDLPGSRKVDFDCFILLSK
ncbi:BnaC02g34230D [Brassica napus]|uniref:(rape) hypothetical protein n=1 Tax=Brassica napus TaxID=3708 RepID=A0A078FSC2_BRANA|nr:unnamed protein product [Brassica napus]CDY15804.1 BnaC02g34230D [Brassica napus]